MEIKRTALEATKGLGTALRIPTDNSAAQVAQANTELAGAKLKNILRAYQDVRSGIQAFGNIWNAAVYKTQREYEQALAANMTYYQQIQARLNQEEEDIASYVYQDGSRFRGENGLQMFREEFAAEYKRRQEQYLDEKKKSGMWLGTTDFKEGNADYDTMCATAQVGALGRAEAKVRETMFGETREVVSTEIKSLITAGADGSFISDKENTPVERWRATLKGRADSLGIVFDNAGFNRMMEACRKQALYSGQRNAFADVAGGFLKAHQELFSQFRAEGMTAEDATAAAWSAVKPQFDAAAGAFGAALSERGLEEQFGETAAKDISAFGQQLQTQVEAYSKDDSARATSAVSSYAKYLLNPSAYPQGAMVALSAADKNFAAAMTWTRKTKQEGVATYEDRTHEAGQETFELEWTNEDGGVAVKTMTREQLATYLEQSLETVDFSTEQGRQYAARVLGFAQENLGQAIWEDLRGQVLEATANIGSATETEKYRVLGELREAYGVEGRDDWENPENASLRAYILQARDAEIRYADVAQRAQTRAQWKSQWKKSKDRDYAKEVPLKRLFSTFGNTGAMAESLSGVSADDTREERLGELTAIDVDGVESPFTERNARYEEDREGRKPHSRMAKFSERTEKLKAGRGVSVNESREALSGMVKEQDAREAKRKRDSAPKAQREKGDDETLFRDAGSGLP